MARTSFSRTVIRTICEVAYADENNDLHDTEVKLWGDYGVDDAERAVRKQTGLSRVLVKNVRHESFYGTMSLEQFAEHCEKKNFKEW